MRLSLPASVYLDGSELKGGDYLHAKEKEEEEIRLVTNLEVTN